jgi:hypothetical protein
MKSIQNFVAFNHLFQQQFKPLLNLNMKELESSWSGNSVNYIPEEDDEDMDLPNPFPTAVNENPDEEYPIEKPDEIYPSNPDEIIEPDEDYNEITEPEEDRIENDDIDEIDEDSITPDDIEIPEPVPGEIDIQEDEENEYPAGGSGGTQPDPEDMDAYPSSNYGSSTNPSKRPVTPEMVLDASFPFHYLSLW